MATPERPPARRAAAVRYRSGHDSPELVARGRGHVADAILEAAVAAGVPIRSDTVLVQALETLELGQHVPPELYAAVAEALVWAYRLTGRRPPA
ncbi:MAG TPA: EscU/YscU/HrcU family type III secretion system export apparatus switch protein [Gaiellales bacterium]|jgi:flagellar biosynthesis protein